MVGLVRADREAKVAQLTTLYSHFEQKSSPGCTTLKQICYNNRRPYYAQDVANTLARSFGRKACLLRANLYLIGYIF